MSTLQLQLVQQHGSPGPIAPTSASRLVYARCSKHPIVEPPGPLGLSFADDPLSFWIRIASNPLCSSSYIIESTACGCEIACQGDVCLGRHCRLGRVNDAVAHSPPIILYGAGDTNRDKLPNDGERMSDQSCSEGQATLACARAFTNTQLRQPWVRNQRSEFQYRLESIEEHLPAQSTPPGVIRVSKSSTANKIFSDYE
jgi:hypothetical protein